MKKCTVCARPDREEIDLLLAQGASERSITDHFGISKSTIHRHVSCVAESIKEAKIERNVVIARNVNDELEKSFVSANALLSACWKYLEDPDHPGEITLTPRATDITVICETAGARYSKLLSELLKDIQDAGHWGKPREYHVKHTDPRTLILDATKALQASVDLLAKLTGAYKEPQENPAEEARRREVVITALYLLSKKKGEIKTREQIDREYTISCLELNALWSQAEDLHIQ